MSKYKINVKIKKQNKKVKKLKHQIDQLKGIYDEMSEELCNRIDQERIKDEKLRYMEDFIYWKKLDAEYAVFRQKAHESTEEDNPFPRLVM